MVIEMVDGRQVDVPEGRIVMAFANPYDYAEDPYKVFEQEVPVRDIVSCYVFDSPKAFLEKWRYEVDHPDGMWYWVMDGRDCICSGACDPGDIEIFEEHLGLEGLLSVGIDKLGLAPQTYRCLRYGHIDTIGDLFMRSDDELLGLKKVGHKTLAEIQEKFNGFWNSYDGFGENSLSGNSVEQVKSLVEQIQDANKNKSIPSKGEERVNLVSR